MHQSFLIQSCLKIKMKELHHADLKNKQMSLFQGCPNLLLLDIQPVDNFPLHIERSQIPRVVISMNTRKQSQAHATEAEKEISHISFCGLKLIVLLQWQIAFAFVGSLGMHVALWDSSSLGVFTNYVVHILDLLKLTSPPVRDHFN